MIKIKIYYDTTNSATYPQDPAEPSWTRVSAVSSFPIVKSRMDETGITVVKLRDFEGALHGIWHAREWTRMKIEDEDGNVIFLGYLTGKTYEANEMTMVISGISKVFQWFPLDKDYILAEGYIDSVPSDFEFEETFNLYPTEDATVGEWGTDQAFNEHYKALRNAAGNINLNNIAAGQIDTFHIVDPGTYDGVITSIDIYIYGNRSKEAGAYPGQSTCDIYWKGAWEGAQALNIPVDDSGWCNITFNVADGTEADIEAVQFRLTGVAHTAIQYTTITRGYLEFTFVGQRIDTLGLVNDDEERTPFDWPVDKWITERDVAILIRENSTGNTLETWLVTGIGQVGGENINAAPNWEDAPDGVYYRAAEIDEDVFDCIVTPVLGGDNIPNTNTISKIEVFYDFRITWVDFCQGQVWLQANRDGVWHDIAGASGGNEWFGTTGVRVEGSYELIGDDKTDYLTLDGANWDEMLGIQFKFWGDHRAGLGSMTLNIDYIKVVITYNAHNISPISETLTNNGASFIQVAGVNWEEMGITDGGEEDGDIFKLGENCKQIVDDIGAACHVNILQLTASTKYMAQHFKGNYGLQILKKVCLLEGWHWWEDFTDGVFGTILVGHLDDLEDSGVDLTSGGNADWVYEGDSNYFSKIIVYGSAAYRIQQSATSQSVESPKTKVFYEETITTNAEALEIAQVQLAEWSVKHPSIKLTLKGVHAAIKIGTEITLTMVRPTVVEANYPVRMIERERLGHGDIKTTVYAGMGHTTASEKMDDRINKVMYLAQKAHADRLITTPAGVGVTGVSWGDIAGADGAVRAIIILEIADGESIDQAIDDLIATHVIAGHTLNQINNPSGDKEFNFANKHLHFKWVAPASGAHEGAFEIEASGAFSGDLIHIHQHTGNVGANTYMVFIECEDADAKCLHLVHGASVFDFGVAGLNLDAALILAATRVITSADEDLTFTFGRCQIDSRFADMMILSHRDMSTQDQYAFGQLNDGKTYINAPTGKLIYFHINDLEKMSMSVNSLAMSVPIAMGGNDISSSGTLRFKVSGDNDDYIQFSTSGTIPRIEIIGNTSLYFESDTVNKSIFLRDGLNLKLRDSTNAEELRIFQQLTLAYITSTTPINIRPSGDNDDYIQFSTTANVPRMSFIGGNGEIKNLADPVDNQDASTKKYVDDSTIATLTLQQVTDHGAITTTAIELQGALTIIAPTADMHAATKIFVESYVDDFIPYTASNDLQFSNDTERTQIDGNWHKLKQITCHISGNIRLYWEHMRDVGSESGQTRIYLNGVAVSTVRAAIESYESEIYDLVIHTGDQLQIYGWALKEAGPPYNDKIWAKNMRIKYTEDFVSDL